MATNANLRTGAAPMPAKRARLALFNIGVGGVDVTFLILVLLILTIGLVMLFSASFAYARFYFNDSFHFIKAQLLFAVLGVFLMLLISTVQYKVLEKLAWPVMMITFVLLVIVLFFEDRNGAHRWIDLGFITFQPSEIAKFAVVILFSHLIVAMGDKMKTFRNGILPFGAILIMIAGLMIMQPHLSGTILILLIGAILMIVGGADLKWFVFAAVSAAVGIAVVIITGAIHYAGSRIEVWRDPFAFPRDEGFQTIQSLYAIGSGGLMGVGIGNSRQKYLYLPEPHNDFIFSVVCEELGFVGATLIIILFSLLVWRGFVIAMRCKDRFGSLVGVGLTAQVGLQTILNIMVVTNTIPNTGISLPFFSYGGTSLVMLLCQMGVMLSISRETTLEKR
ncbi:MAG: putative lipid II flippase FtsW [Oscillospiraceae bacterium]|nr:putative lipid II flippase FtsW [Oscillospiraceae bacterium]